MKRRRTRTGPANVTVGWVEVWTSTPDALVCETAPIKVPRLTARYEDGHYRLLERKPLVLPEEYVA